jgi:hypothetical protein
MRKTLYFSEIMKERKHLVDVGTNGKVTFLLVGSFAHFQKVLPYPANVENMVSS